MKKFFLPLFFLILTVSLSGCGLVEDAFKAGVIFAVVIVIIIGIVIWVLRMVIKQLAKTPKLRLKES